MNNEIQEEVQTCIFPLELHDKFFDHLNLDANYRVIFSAKYGMGKTTFLNEFFKQSKYCKNFIPIFLSPLNYSVIENHDIFDAIKHDIIVKLQENYPDVFKDSFQTVLDKHFSFIKENKFLLLKIFFQIGKEIAYLGFDMTKNILLKIGNSIFDSTYENMEELYNKYKTDTKSSEDIVKDFNNQVYEGRIKIYEQDIVTKVIQESIKKLNSKVILIIDDLDRIDPDHLFRVLNIFSSHYDLATEEKNKFGFNQIITVCDINNIRNIYHHKYGDSTSFDGYIDKFISREIYIFDSHKIIKSFVDSVLSSIVSNVFQNKTSDTLFYDDEAGEQKKYNYNLYQSYIEPILSGILKILIEFRVINFRNILTLKSVDFVSQIGDDKFLYFETFNTKHYSPVIYILKILICIRNSSGQLIRDFEYLSNKSIPLYPRIKNDICYEIFLLHLLAMIRIKDVRNDHKLLETLPKNHPLIFEGVHYRIKESPFTDHWQAVTSKSQESQIKKINIWNLLSLATSALQDEGVL